MVLESFSVSFFSTDGVFDGAEADDDSVEGVLVSGTSDPSSEEEAPPNRPLSLPRTQEGLYKTNQKIVVSTYQSENRP